MKIPGKHFVNIEPCLGLVDLDRYLGRIKLWRQDQLAYAELASQYPNQEFPRLDGVILGGESGHRARPMHPKWARGPRDQCIEAGIDFFFKQWGEWVFPDQMTDDTFRAVDDAHNLGNTGYTMWRVGKKAAGRLLDGQEWNDLPWIEKPKK